MKDNQQVEQLLKLAFEAFEVGDVDKAREFQRELDKKLKEHGEDPLAFWANLSQMSNEHWGTET